MFATLTGALSRELQGGPSLDAPTTGDGGRDDRAAATDQLVREWLADQETAGLEPLTDGQVRFLDLAADVALRLGGVERIPGGGIRANATPRWSSPILLDGWRFAAGATARAVKQAVPGPYTIGRRLAMGQGGHGLTLAVADALANEVRELAAAGCPLIEVEEPGAAAIGDDDGERQLFVEAQRRLLRHVGGTHACLVVAGADASGAGEATFVATPYASFLFDLIAAPDHWRVIARAPGQRGIVCGALDPREDAQDDPALLVWAAHYAASTGGRGLARVGLSNAGTMRFLDRERALRKMRVLAEAARIASAGSVDEIAALLDPRATDSRIAALGRVRPTARRPQP